MCAINGVTKRDPGLVRKMNEATRHRGPDGTGIYEDASITLGHNRLAIIDLSPEAAQPMHSNDGRYVITFNGEIYNYLELKRELEGAYDFRTQSDTEVLLAAYVAWGESMLDRLRGIFAFGIWDKKKETLLLVRDHMGVKPLYYAQNGRKLSFSSELSGILQCVEDPRIDTNSLAFYLSMQYVPSPHTLVRGVKKLSPGHILRYREGHIETSSYLKPVPEQKTESGEHIYQTIDRAVKQELVSDRPIGAYLSGGFDSSIVAHHMTKHRDRVRTYSVDFEMVAGSEDESAKFNSDARLAERTAAIFGTDHKTFTVGLNDIRESLEQVIGSIDEPVANATAITQYHLNRFVRDDGTVVVLGGDGGDELFGGYTRHRHAMGAYLFQQLPTFMQKTAALVHGRLGKLSTPFPTPFHMAVLVNDESNITPFLKQPFPIEEPVKAYFDERYRTLSTKRHPVDVFMEVDRQTWLPDECFVRIDHTSMAHGLELRVPISNIDVVALSDQISIWEKTLPHQGKRIIRKMYKAHLPKHLYTEPKRGWLSPAAKWFRDPVIGAFAKDVYSSQYYDGLDGIFDWESVHSLLNDHVEKRGYHLYPLWNILALQVWARKYNIRA